jgi:nicotinate-nucleotide pyrophosphorylase (carboxylating)
VVTDDGPRMPHDRGHLLWTSSGGPERPLLASFDRWTTAILGDDDISEFIMAEGPVMEGSIISKENGIVAGCSAVDYMLQIWCPDIQITWKANEGKSIQTGDIIAFVKGSSNSLLRMERSILNILGQLSGIATETNRWATIAPKQIACTRKTVWGLLDKWAVHLGGGLTHRLSKNDAMMIKENDLASHDDKDSTNSQRITSALTNIQKEEYGAFLEIEVRTAKEAMLAAGVWKSLGHEEKLVIMLDNLSPADCKNIAEEMEQYELREFVILEASGGITFDTLPNWKECKMDVLSTSALNRGTAPLDMSMMLEE